MPEPVEIEVGPPYHCWSVLACFARPKAITVIVGANRDTRATEDRGDVGLSYWKRRRPAHETGAPTRERCCAVFPGLLCQPPRSDSRW